jgi:hypothetical protein
MNNKLPLLLIPVLFVLAYLAGQWLIQPENQTFSEMRSMRFEPCDPVVGPCSGFIAELPVTLSFAERPSALRPFKVLLETNLPISSVELDFTMQGMDMGINRFGMQQQSDGRWQGEMILPVCSLGRNDWTVELRVVYENALWTAHYNFEQAGN